MLLKKRLICLGLIISIFGMYIMPGVLGAVLGTDPSQDLRKFNPVWLEANTADPGDWGDPSNILEQIYISLRDNWDNPEACSGLSLTEYNLYNFIDILSISITGLEDVNATFTVTVAGDAQHASLPWMLFIWSNCTPDDNGFWIISGYVPAGIDWEEWGGLFGMYGDENVTGELDFGAGGSDINMNFPSDWWDEDANCGLRVIMVTVDNIDAIGYYIIDIYPNPDVPIWLNLWFWLIILIILVAIIAGYVIYKNSKSSKKSTKKKRRVR